MDKEMATRFVSMLLGVLRTEIAETTQRVERLNDAAAHNADARAQAQAALEKIRAQRAERERRMLGGEFMTPPEG